MEYACFISSQALLSCGALERARSTFKLASSSKSFWQEAVSTVRGTGFGALGANAFRPLGRDLGMPKGSRGGIWAIRPSAGTAQAARPPLLGLLWSGSSRDDNLSLRSPKGGPMVRAICQEWLATWLQVTIDVFHAGPARSIRSFVPIDHSKLSASTPR